MLDHHEDCHVGNRANMLADEANDYLTGLFVAEHLPGLAKPSLPDRLHRRFAAWLDRHEAAAPDVDGWWTRHAWAVALAATVAVWVGIGLALGWAL